MNLLEAGIYKTITDPSSNERVAILFNPTPEQVLNISLNKSSDNMVRLAIDVKKGLLLAWPSDYLHYGVASILGFKYPDSPDIIYFEALPDESGKFMMTRFQSYIDMFENPEEYKLGPSIKLFSQDMDAFKEYFSEKGYKEFTKRLKDFAKKLGMLQLSLEEKLEKHEVA